MRLSDRKSRMSRTEKRGRLTRRSVVITDEDFILEAGRLMNSLSEAALPHGFLGLLGGDRDVEGLNPDLEALSLEIRTDWCRGRLSRSLIFEVSQRVREEGGSVLSEHSLASDDDDGCCESGEVVVNDLLGQVVDTAVEFAEADRRDEFLRSLLSSHVPAPLLERQEVQQVSQSIFIREKNIVIRKILPVNP